MNPMNAAKVLPHPGLSLEMVSTWCRQADILPRDFYSTDEVVQILDAAGYAIEEEVIEEYARKGYIAPLPPQKNRWPIIAVHQMAIALEQRRRWKLSPSCHDSKKTAAELQAERVPEQFADAARDVSLEDLVLLLFLADDPQERGFLYVLALAKLALLGIQE